jgi:LCP family protein required for cell wall assembly
MRRTTGDRHTFEDRFGVLAALSYRVAYRLTGDRAESEDLAQEALARAATRRRSMFEHLDDPRPPAFGDGFRRTVVHRAHRRRRRRLAGGVGVAAASLVAGAGGLYARAALRLDDVERTRVSSTGEVPAGDPVTFLLLGLDRRNPSEQGRSDTIILARLAPGSGTASLMSLPRDLMVTDPATGRPERLNALAERDLSALVGAVESQVGAPVDHVLQVDFGGFVSLVDRVGGIHVQVGAPLRDRSSGFSVDTPGCVELDGEQALALVRSRHLEVQQPSGSWVEDPAADLARMANQRAVAVATLSDLETRPDPFTANQLADWLVENVTADDALSVAEIARLIESTLTLDPGSVHEATLPVVEYAPDPNRLAIDTERAPAVIAAFLDGAPLPAAPPLPGLPAAPPGGQVTAC